MNRVKKIGYMLYFLIHWTFVWGWSRKKVLLHVFMFGREKKKYKIKFSDIKLEWKKKLNKIKLKVEWSKLCGAKCGFVKMSFLKMKYIIRGGIF